MFTIPPGMMWQHHQGQIVTTKKTQAPMNIGSVVLVMKIHCSVVHDLRRDNVGRFYLVRDQTTKVVNTRRAQ